MPRLEYPRSRTTRWAVLLFCLFGAAVIGKTRQPPSPSPSPDQIAWQILAQSTGPAATATADTPVAWRLWATSQDAYGNAALPASFVFPAVRPLPCQRSTQNSGSTALVAQCEVIFLDPVATKFVATNHLGIREDVRDLAAKGLHFYDQSKEIKTEWIPIADSDTDYIVAYNGNNRYGLVAFHMKAKVLPNSKWLWATWIQKNRVPSGFPTKGAIDPSLQPAVPILSNYLLIGTQTDVDLARGTLLGNPLIEGLKDPTLQSSSCVGCHQNAAVAPNGSWPGVPNRLPLLTQLRNLPPNQHPTDSDFGPPAKSLCHSHSNDCTDQASVPNL